MEANGEFQFGVKVVKYIQRRIDFSPRFFSVFTLDSTGGMTLPKLGGGTYSLSLESLLDILADTEANGGANTTLDPGVSAGSAVVSIAPTEEILFRSAIQPGAFPAATIKTATQSRTYDMAGRLRQKDYRTRANSPSGTIADSDMFTKE